MRFPTRFLYTVQGVYLIDNSWRTTSADSLNRVKKCVNLQLLCSKRESPTCQTGNKNESSPKTLDHEQGVKEDYEQRCDNEFANSGKRNCQKTKPAKITIR